MGGGEAQRPLAGLRGRLESHREEIEEALLARVYSVADPTTVRDPQYAEGLKAAVSAALDYGLVAIESGEERAGSIPAPLLSQARQAARNGVNLDTVLRRYIAGHTMLGGFVMREAEADETLRGTMLQRVLQAQAALLDRLVAAITREHMQAARSLTDLSSIERRRGELVKGLLAGELLDTSELTYDLAGHHLGMLASGANAERTIREIANSFDRRLLLIRPDQSTIWAWLGGRCELEADEVVRLASPRRRGVVSLAVGEPGEGLEGWRLTHRQAAATWPIAQRDPRSILRYAEVALLASAVQDEVLTSSLRKIYLDPLRAERDGGAALRQTIRAYFATGRSITSTAATLEVTRQTVRTRLRTVEEQINRPLDQCAVELEITLRIDAIQDLGLVSTPPAARSGVAPA